MRLYAWITACIYRETADTVTIVFNESNERLHFKAGQFINRYTNDQCRKDYQGLFIDQLSGL
jgi:TorA maturation chaperone TorD